MLQRVMHYGVVSEHWRTCSPKAEHNEHMILPEPRAAHTAELSAACDLVRDKVCTVSGKAKLLLQICGSVGAD